MGGLRYPRNSHFRLRRNVEDFGVRDLEVCKYILKFFLIGFDLGYKGLVPGEEVREWYGGERTINE